MTWNFIANILLPEEQVKKLNNSVICQGEKNAWRHKIAHEVQNLLFFQALGHVYFIAI